MIQIGENPIPCFLALQQAAIGVYLPSSAKAEDGWNTRPCRRSRDRMEFDTVALDSTGMNPGAFVITKEGEAS